MENRNQSVRILFHLPLICSAALLSFAHGANDVANAVGPLAAILNAVQTGSISAKVGIPVLVMLIGAAVVIASNVLVIWREHQLGLERARLRSMADPKG